jgi:hypothetical protein
MVGDGGVTICIHSQHQKTPHFERHKICSSFRTVAGKAQRLVIARIEDRAALANRANVIDALRQRAAADLHTP